jgi:N-acetyl-alpha-D-glucosaminyl L-malate synthase BshA
VVTAVSESLRAATARELKVAKPILVIPNFLDTDVYRRVEAGALRRRFCGSDARTALITHISNFRPVKRIDAVVDVFDRIRHRLSSRLLLVGDGPELEPALRLARERGLHGLVHSVGAQENVIALLSASDLFLLPSAQESFGLAALEAMACEVPVVASDVGGLPEVIEHGVSGFLHEPQALDAMAASAVDILTDAPRHAEVARAARQRVLTRFCVSNVVPAYESCYRDALGLSAT